jgi:hypothetical protein
MRQVKMSLQLMLLAASGCVVAGQYCPTNAVQAACSSILVIYWTNDDWGMSVKNALEAMGDFEVVDFFNALYGTPDASFLASYDAVIIFGAEGLLDPDGLGDRLATYFDQGGGVVVAGLANQNDFCVHGAWRDPQNGYALLDYTSTYWSNSADSLGAILEPDSPLLKDVYSLSASPYGDRTVAYSGSVINGGVVVAKWGIGGTPLLLRGVRGNRMLVELTFYAVYVSSRQIWPGDGLKLLRNALKFSRCIACQPGSYPTEGEGSKSP